MPIDSHIGAACLQELELIALSRHAVADRESGRAGRGG
jgi:hypothetical protein